MANITEHSTQIDGRDVRYYEAGEPHRETIFLVHGLFGAAHVQWQELMELMADEFYLIAVDLPGYGGSAPLSQTSPTSLVNWLKQLIDRLGLDRVILVGNSLGGLVCRLFAAQNPKQVEVLVLVNGGVIPSIPPVARFLAQLPLVGNAIYLQIAKSSTQRSGLGSILHNKDLLTDEFITEVQKDRRALGNLMRSLSAASIKGTTIPEMPVLLIWGEEDTMTPKESGEMLVKKIPNAHLSMIADCRHMPHVEEPDIFMWQIKNYLKERHRTHIPPKNKKNLQ